MEIVRIHFKGEKFNEMRRLLTLWNDTAYLYEFVTKNKSDIPKDLNILALVSQIIDHANDIDDRLYEISSNPEKGLEEFFKPLDNQEYHIVELSKQKGRKNYLRLFAIKIDYHCFVIRPHTQKEMQKMDRCRDYLKDNGVFDADSFYEFLNEQQ
jgi:hypothetical protein